MTNDILDSDLMRDSGFALASGELLVWQGRPKRYFSVSMVEVVTRDANVSAPAVAQLILSVVLIFMLVYFLDGSDNLYNLLITLGLLLAALVPDGLKHLRKLKTDYYLTTSRLVICTLRHFMFKQHSIPLEQIKEVTYEGYKDGYGTLFIKVEASTKVRTYDFFTGARRHFPTLELVPDYATVKKEMDRLRAVVLDQQQT